MDDHSDTRTGDRTRIPYDPDAEAALLGAMLLSPAAVDVGLGRVTDAHFHVVSNGHVFAAVRRVYDVGEDVDPVTVSAELRRMGLDDEVGGTAALLDLEDRCPSAAAAPSYAAIVERHYRQRRMIVLASDVAEQARAGVDWHETLGRVLELGGTNGVVYSPSTVDFVDLGPVVSGDAAEERPLWLRRTDGRGLLYPGRVHDLHSPPSIGKTWVSCAAILDVLEAGGNVLLLDYEDSASNIVSRLRAIGTPDELIGDPTRFRYANPTGTLGLAERAHLARVLDELRPDLVVLDGVASALARSGYDENSNTEVNLWADVAVKPFAAAGAAVLLLDHVTKNADRARGARGAGSKLALITGASYELKLSRAYSRTRAGLARLVIAKDRVGHVGGIGETAAEIAFHPNNGGALLDLTISPPDTAGTHRLTGLMEQLSRRLEAAAGPLSAAALTAGFRTEHRHLDRALADLTADGYTAKIEIPGATTTYRTDRPYREPDDDGRPGNPDRTRRTDRAPGPDDDRPGRDEPDSTDPTNVVPLFVPGDDGTRF